MNETRALVPVAQGGMTLAETMTLGETLAKSGFFSDTKDAAKAVVKILAGRELGFGPIASMTGIHIIQGKVAVGANLMGAAVKSDPRYDYRVAELNDDRCELAFYEGGKEIGRSSFSMEDAVSAGLANKDNWRKFPRNMLFSRAISNGARWYCPDACGGQPVYTPDELGAVVDGETGEIIDVTPEPRFTKPKRAATPKSTNGNGKAATVVEPLPPDKWDTIIPPEDFNDLWTREMWALIGFKAKQHAQNTVKGEKFENAGDMWQFLVDHQRSKIDDKVPA